MRDLIRWHFSLVSAGATTDDIFSKVIKAGKIAVLTKVSVKNETTAYTRLEVGVHSMGILQPYEEEDTPAADVLYWTDKPLGVGEGERLHCRFTGNTSGDVLHVYAQGYMQDMKDFNLATTMIEGLKNTEHGEL